MTLLLHSQDTTPHEMICFLKGTTLQTLRRAGPDDLQLFVTMMAEFYSESPYTLNPRRAAAGFAPLLAEDRLGHVWFIQSNSKDVGFVVVTLPYSMEYGGPTAVVDDFFIRSASRGAGSGKLEKGIQLLRGEWRAGDSCQDRH